MSSTPAGSKGAAEIAPADTPEQPTNAAPLGFASVPPGKRILYLTPPVAMETIRTEQEGTGRRVGRHEAAAKRHVPLGPRPGQGGESSRESPPGLSAGTKCCLGPGVAAGQPGSGYMVQGLYSCIRRYHNHYNSPSSHPLHGTLVPGTGINSQTSSTPEVGAILTPFPR